MFNSSYRGTADYYSGGRIFVRKNDKIGLIDKENQIVFPFIYKEISSCNEKYLCVSFDKIKYGLVDFENKNILPFSYDFLITNGKYLNFGELSETIIENYDTAVNFLMLRENKLIKHGIIDFAGNIIVPAISDTEIRNFIDGKAMCYDEGKEEYFAYDSVTEEIINAPDDLLEDETECVRVNFIRNLVGIRPIYYPNIE